MSKFLPLSIPNLSDVEKAFVNEAIDDGWVSSVGPHVDQFEKKFAEYLGVEHAVACSSGTAALHISLILKGVEHGDEVLMPNMTFVATANAVAYIGAEPVFLDIDTKTLGICNQSLSSFIEQYTEFNGTYLINKKTGRRVKAILPVHMLGTPVDMDPLLEICSKYNIEVVEDATESLGATYKGKMSGTISDISCFSFNGNKIITTGGGGIITTNEPELAKRAKHLTTTAKTDPVFFEHDEVGYNYRMVNVLAAIGLGQLSRLDSFIDIKRNTHKCYAELLNDVEGVSLFTAPENCESNYWLNMVSFDEPLMAEYSLRELVKFFADRGIQTRPMWTLLNQMPMYKHCFSMPQPQSEALHSRSLSIPSSTCIEHDDILRVSEAIRAIVESIGNKKVRGWQ